MSHAYGVKNWSKKRPAGIPWSPPEKPEPWIPEFKLVTRKHLAAKAAKRRKAKLTNLIRAKAAAETRKLKAPVQRKKKKLTSKK